jgi:small subunit ribosomal protein S8
MSTTNDSISDMLTRVRNAIMARHESTSIPVSRPVVAIAQILRDEGYIDSFEVVEGKPVGSMVVHLRYLADRTNVIRSIQRVSKPSRRVYVGVSEIPRVKNGLGVAILSTSKGVMTGTRAREQQVGGEVLCTVW